MNLNSSWLIDLPDRPLGREIETKKHGSNTDCEVYEEGTSAQEEGLVYLIHVLPNVSHQIEAH